MVVFPISVSYWKHPFWLVQKIKIIILTLNITTEVSFIQKPVQ